MAKQPIEQIPTKPVEQKYLWMKTFLELVNKLIKDCQHTKGKGYEQAANLVKYLQQGRSSAYRDNYFVHKDEYSVAIHLINDFITQHSILRRGDIIDTNEAGTISGQLRNKITNFLEEQIALYETLQSQSKSSELPKIGETILSLKYHTSRVSNLKDDWKKAVSDLFDVLKNPEIYNTLGGDPAVAPYSSLIDVLINIRKNQFDLEILKSGSYVAQNQFGIPNNIFKFIQPVLLKYPILLNKDDKNKEIMTAAEIKDIESEIRKIHILIPSANPLKSDDKNSATVNPVAQNSAGSNKEANKKKLEWLQKFLELINNLKEIEGDNCYAKVNNLLTYLQKGEYTQFKNNYRNHTDYQVIILCTEEYIGRNSILNQKDLITPEMASAYATDLQNKSVAVLEEDIRQLRKDRFLSNDPVEGIRQFDHKPQQPHPLSPPPVTQVNNPNYSQNSNSSGYTRNPFT